MMSHDSECTRKEILIESLKRTRRLLKLYLKEESETKQLHAAQLANLYELQIMFKNNLDYLKGLP